MAIKPPNQTLEPGSQMWRRFVDDNIIDLHTQARVLSDSVDNAHIGTQGAINQLGQQIARLTEVTNRLDQQQQELGNQQAQLTTLVNSLPVTLVDSTQVTGFQAGNGQQVRASVSFTRPPGMTRVSVWASIQGTYISDWDVPNSDRAAFRIGLGSQRSDWALEVPGNMDSYLFSGSGAFAANAGATVTVSAYSTAGPTLAPAYPENKLTLSVLAVFSI